MLTVHALAYDGLIDPEKADDWCLKNGFVLRKRNVFQTISDLFTRYPDAGQGSNYWVRVTIIPPLLQGDKKKAPVLSIVDDDDDSKD